MNIYLSISNRSSSGIVTKVTNMLRDYGHEVIRYEGDKVYLDEKIKNKQVDAVIFIPFITDKSGESTMYFGMGQMNEIKAVSEANMLSFITPNPDKLLFGKMKEINVRDMDNWVTTAVIKTFDETFDESKFEQSLKDNPLQPEIHLPDKQNDDEIVSV